MPKENPIYQAGKSNWNPGHYFSWINQLSEEPENGEFQPIASMTENEPPKSHETGETKISFRDKILTYGDQSAIIISLQAQVELLIEERDNLNAKIAGLEVSCEISERSLIDTTMDASVFENCLRIARDGLESLQNDFLAQMENDADGATVARHLYLKTKQVLQRIDSLPADF